ncbi:MAG: bifunctional DNA-formamidopyrimidine glycosylase/DNA-(apurinic or apyrimidinic site) lyase [Acidimicrobiales bacterium]
MPELPEVETLRRDLDHEVSGRLITGVRVSGARTVRRQRPEVLAARMKGTTVAGVGRRGKYLLFSLAKQVDAAHLRVLVVHLGMSGQLSLASDAQVSDRPHTRLRVSFSDGAELRFVDPRTFGECWVSTVSDEGVVPELAHLGFEPLGPGGERLLSEGLRRTRRQVKPLLMDQRFVVGIGNIYSDEMLHGARICWDRPAASLVPDEVDLLYRTMVSTLTRAIELRGSSLADAQYRDLSGEVGAFQSEHKVYARAGQPCHTCGTPIVRVALGGRGTHFCPCCQT